MNSLLRALALAAALAAAGCAELAERAPGERVEFEFTARFGGVSQPVSVPVGAVLAVYARETGQGMVLPEEGAGGPHAHGDEAHDGDGPDTPPEGPADPPPGKRPHLRVVK